MVSLRVYVEYIVSRGTETLIVRHAHVLNVLMMFLLFFFDQEITWSGVVYVYLLGTDHLIPDV